MRLPPSIGDPPSKAQTRTFDAFFVFQQEHKRPPTLRELAGTLRVSHQAVQESLNILVVKGYIITGSPDMASRYRLAQELHD
jgi:DNA-binding MarR family transcriptional regulator